MQNNSAAEIFEVIKSSQNPILCIDGRMDLDAYCSALSLFQIFKENFNKKIKLFSSHPALSAYYEKVIKGFNIDTSDITFGTDPITIDFSAYDLQIFTDTGTVEHISQDIDFKPNENIKKVNIDHHGGNNFYGDYNFVYECSSACSVFNKLLKENDIRPNAYVSQLLLIGILSDSLFLRTSNVQAYEYQDVGELIKISEFPVYKLNQILSSSTFEDTLIKKIVYKNLIINKEKKFAYSFASLKDYKALNLDPEYKGVPPADVIKYIEGLDFVFFIREDKQKFNVSFRSVNLDFDVLQFAQKLNGGGHKVAAAGVIQSATVQDAVNEVLNLTNNI